MVKVRIPHEDNSYYPSYCNIIIMCDYISRIFSNNRCGILAVVGVVIFALVFLRVIENDAPCFNMIMMIIWIQFPQSIKDQKQLNTIDGRQENSLDVFNTFPLSFASEGEPAILDREADVDCKWIKTVHISTALTFICHKSSIIYYYRTSVGIAPEIETEENATYH